MHKPGVISTFSTLISTFPTLISTFPKEKGVQYSNTVSKYPFGSTPRCVVPFAFTSSIDEFDFGPKHKHVSFIGRNCERPGASFRRFGPKYRLRFRRKFVTNWRIPANWMTTSAFFSSAPPEIASQLPRKMHKQIQISARNSRVAQTINHTHEITMMITRIKITVSTNQTWLQQWFRYTRESRSVSTAQKMHEQILHNR
jgi:hypothetical protein